MNRRTFLTMVVAAPMLRLLPPFRSDHPWIMGVRRRGTITIPIHYIASGPNEIQRTEYRKVTIGQEWVTRVTNDPTNYEGEP